MADLKTFTLTGTTPASASTAIIATQNGLRRYDFFTIHALLAGATGGTLDVYLQRKLATDIWADWVHFAQLAAADPAVKYAISSGYDEQIQTVGTGTDASPNACVLSAGTFVGGHPGESVRLVATAGASTSAGATATVYLTAWMSGQ